jgi:flagellar FliJ protein
MSRDFALQPLLELMRDRTDVATRRLGQLIGAEQDARKRLALLGQYREEYFQRFREAQAAGLTPHAWSNYQDFIDRLDLAILQQTAQVETSVRNTAAGQEHWRTQNTRLKAIDTLAVRHRQALLKKDARQEQKQLDEFAARRYQQRIDE